MPTAQVHVYDSTLTEGPATMTIPVDPAISNANATALLDAALALSEGAEGLSKLVIDTVLATAIAARPADTEVQKEKRFQVKFTDNVTGKKYYFTIPCANLALLGAGTENVPLTDTEAAALVTAFQTNGRSELGNAVTVNEIVYASY